MRLRNCKRCGKPYQTDRPDTYLCPICSADAKRECVIRERTCRQCGNTFLGGPRAWYCPSCRRDRSRDAAQRQRKHGSARPLGSMDRCVVCGDAYVVAAARQRYCKKCAASAIKAADREAGKQYYLDNREPINAHRAKMRTERKVCSICGKVFDAITPTVTCSETCATELRHRRQREADRRRAPRQKTSEKGENTNE